MCSARDKAAGMKARWPSGKVPDEPGKKTLEKPFDVPMNQCADDEDCRKMIISGTGSFFLMLLPALSFINHSDLSAICRTLVSVSDTVTAANGVVLQGTHAIGFRVGHAGFFRGRLGFTGNEAGTYAQ
jgi:hypothetical protein